MKIWMLTGDKMETAENIAKSCNLIQPHFQILRYLSSHIGMTARTPLTSSQPYKN